VIHLTKQEQTVLWVVLALLLTGLAVKTYRAKSAGRSAPEPAAIQSDSLHNPPDSVGDYADREH
jgi:hypothetical protein